MALLDASTPSWLAIRQAMSAGSLRSAGEAAKRKLSGRKVIGPYGGKKCGLGGYDLTGDEWQAYFHGLLPFIHGLGEYEAVPSEDCGDLGIEAFSFDGRVYQCFADQNSKTTRQRYEKQRDKLTSDIAKFCTRQAKFKKLLGTTKISRWILVVPNKGSKDLIAHAAAMTAEVLARNLEYVTADFKIVTIDLKDLRSFETLAQRSNVRTIELSKPAVSEAELEAIQGDYRTNLERKIERLYPTGSVQYREKRIRLLLKEHAIGQNHLVELESIPETHTRLTSEIQAKSRRLETLGATAGATPKAVLETELEDLIHRLEAAAPEIGTETRESIVLGMITHWLMLCSLDFDHVASS